MKYSSFLNKKKDYKLYFNTSLFILFLFVFNACADEAPPPSETKQKTQSNAPTTITNGPKVTFVELGSVSCIPCIAMKKVMDSLEVKYPKDLKIVFHDVWTEEGKPAGRKYRIRTIPTQIFLDSEGKEFFRHEGYFPFNEIEKILKAKQVSK